MSENQTKTATMTKKAIAIKTVKTMNRRKKVPARKAFIEAIMEKAGLSKAGAATYYQNIVSGKWS